MQPRTLLALLFLARLGSAVPVLAPAESGSGSASQIDGAGDPTAVDFAALPTGASVQSDAPSVTDGAELPEQEQAASNPGSHYGPVDPRPKPKPFFLRILPLGASITWGSESSDGNGYRGALREALRYDGWSVNMVGTRQNGNMKDNENEGWPGYRVEQITKKAEVAVGYKPNVVLINAGTNDALQNFDVPSIGRRFDELLETVFAGSPGTTIIVSTLVPNQRVSANVNSINDQYRQIVKERHDRGDKILLAEMYGAITLDDIVDGTHPGDGGYRKMAAVWHKALLKAEESGMLEAPSQTAIEKQGLGTFICNPRQRRDSPLIVESDMFTNPDVAVAGVEAEVDVKKRTLVTLPQPSQPADVQMMQFARLTNDDERDQPVWRIKNDGLYWASNDGNGRFGRPQKIASDIECDKGRIFFADMDGNGYDDLICLMAGQMRVYYSAGEGDVVSFIDEPVQVAVPGIGSPMFGGKQQL